MVVNFMIRFEPMLYLMMEEVEVNTTLNTARDVAFPMISKEIEEMGVNTPRLESDWQTTLDAMCAKINVMVNDTFADLKKPIESELEWYTVDNYTLTLRVKEGASAHLSRAVH